MGEVFQKVSLLIAFMAILAAVEAWIPFRARGTRGVGPNLGLMALFFVINLLVTAPLVLAAEWLSQRQFGLLHEFSRTTPGLALGVLILDLGAYLVHVLMHKVSWMWRFHRVHHSDLMVDVTTAYRQHPVETVFRFAFTAAPALALGVSPEAIAIYRTLSGCSAIVEHANVKPPEWLDRALRAVIVSPILHKVHHSRAPVETDSNYGNILSVFDRMFGTLTPASRASSVRYGLEGHDEPSQQSLAGLLRLPWEKVK